MSLISSHNVNVSDKIVQKIKKNTHYMSKDFFFLNCAVYEIMWKNIVQPGLLHIYNMAHALSMLDT